MPKYYVEIEGERVVIDRPTAREAVAAAARLHPDELEEGATATVSEQGFGAVIWTCYRVGRTPN